MLIMMINDKGSLKCKSVFAKANEGGIISVNKNYSHREKNIIYIYIWDKNSILN